MKTFTFRYSPSEPSIGKRIKDAVNGKPHVRPNELVSTNLKGLLQVASESRLELFEAILHEKPTSIYALAEKLGKSQPYILKEVRVLEALGLIRLHREHDGSRERVRPEALYSKIIIDCGFNEKKEAS
jgi:predicted transcriptional regulator